MKGTCYKCGKDTEVEVVILDSGEKYLCKECLQKLRRRWCDWYSY